LALFDFLKRRRPEDEFAGRVMARLRERGWPHELTYDRKSSRIFLGAAAGALSLGNVYRDWLTYPPEERTSALDLIVAPVFETAEETPHFEEVRERILPLVRNSCDYALDARTGDALPATASFAGPLSLLLAIDQPTSIRVLMESDLAAWGMSFDAVLKQAIQNLETKSPCRFQREEGGFYVSHFEDFYDPSRLLLPRLFDQLDLRGAPVAIAATRYCVVVAGRDDPEALKAMAAYVDEGVSEASRPISYTPLVLTHGAWSSFSPTEPTLAALRALMRKQQIWDYGKQQDVLNDEPLERELFVAAADSSWDGDELLTWATWTEGVPTLLPRVDYIGVTDLKIHLFRRWDDVEAVCGPFEVEEGYVPVRYLVDRWPTPAEWARLRDDFQAPVWGPD
jgi:hypothetical protein